MGKGSYLHRRTSKTRQQTLTDEKIETVEQAVPDASQSTITDFGPRLPMMTYVSAQPGPGGTKDMWVSVQINHGSMAMAFALDPRMVDDWVRDTSRDMRSMAGTLMRRNRGLIVPDGALAEGPRRELWFPGRDR